MVIGYDSRCGTGRAPSRPWGYGVSRRGSNTLDLSRTYCVRRHHGAAGAKKEVIGWIVSKEVILWLSILSAGWKWIPRERWPRTSTKGRLTISEQSAAGTS